ACGSNSPSGAGPTPSNGGSSAMGTGGLVGSGGGMMGLGGNAMGSGGLLPNSGGTPGSGGSMMTLGPYPSGPYAIAVGSYLPDFKLQGYVNPTATGISNTLPVTNYSMDDLRASGVRYAFLHNSEFF